MASYKIIGGDQKEYGPETADQLRRWIAEGRLNGHSLVQEEGTDQWRPLFNVPELSSALHGASSVAASFPAAPPIAAAAWPAQVLARRPEFRLGQCLSGAWKLLCDNFRLLFGACFIVWLITSVCQWIPLIGGIVSLLLFGVLYGGLYLVFLRRIRGQSAAVSDVFTGFGPTFVQLMLAGLLTMILTWIGFAFCLIPGLYLMVAWILGVPLAADRGLEFWSAMELSRKVVTRVWFEVAGLMFLAFLPFIIAYVVCEAKIIVMVMSVLPKFPSSGPPDLSHMMDAMKEVMKSTLPLVAAIKLVLLFNLPFGLGALAHAYESLFGARTAPAS